MKSGMTHSILVGMSYSICSSSLKEPNTIFFHSNRNQTQFFSFHRNESFHSPSYSTNPNVTLKLTPDLETGDCLMEVFRVIVNREGHISGKIFIDIKSQLIDIYKAEEEEYVSKGGDLLLPGAVLPTLTWVRIFADLNHKTKFYHSTRFNIGVYSEESRRLNNYSVCLDEKGRFDESKYRGFYWRRYNGKHLRNTPLSHKITSGKLTATLLFALFQSAILATVEVRLINESSEKIGVYGLIAARNSMFEDPRYKCILFRKNFTERVPLVPEDPIQLSRSVLAVPVEFNLIVRVDLRSKDTNIPRGELTFPVPIKLRGMSEKVLGDKVQVRVTWKHYWMEKRDLSVRISKEEEKGVSKQCPIPLKLTPAIETYIETQRKYFDSIGDCLMEVFRVIVNREGHISGKIFINTGPPQMTDIYNSEEEEYVKKGGDLLLPGAVLPTLDGVLIFADLNHKTKKSYRNTRFSKGSYSEQSRRLNNYDECLDEGKFQEARYMGFFWHYNQPEGQRLLDTPLSHKITSGNLTATLLFAFFHSAIQATVEVRLINESSENIGVYGLIEARNNMFKDPRYKCVLSRKTFTNRVPLVRDKREDSIQLSRSVLAVPVEFNLIVRVHLRSKDTNIPRGELTFPVPVELRGMSEKLLGDKVQVKVTWKHYWK